MIITVLPVVLYCNFSLHSSDITAGPEPDGSARTELSEDEQEHEERAVYTDNRVKPSCTELAVAIAQ